MLRLYLVFRWFIEPSSVKANFIFCPQGLQGEGERMKNFNKFFGLFALILGAMITFGGCTQPAGVDGTEDSVSAPDSAISLVQFGTNKNIDVKVDDVGYEGYGTVVPYFSKGSLRYIVDVGLTNMATLNLVATIGTDVSSEGVISVGYNQAIYFAYLPDGSSNWAAQAKLSVWEVKSNKDFFSKYNIKASSFDDPGIYLGLAFKKVGTSYYGKIPGGSLIKTLFSDSKDDLSAYPTSTTGTNFTGQVSVQSYKYMLVSYWQRGADQTDNSLAQRGYVEVDGNSYVPSAKSTSGGFGYSSGQNVTLNIGDKVTFYVAESGVSELYYYVSQSAVEPSDKATVFSGRQNVASNGYISIDVTYSGGLMYLFAWTKSSSGAYSSFFKLIVTQGGGGLTTTNPVQSLTLSQQSITIPIGGTATLQAFVNPTNATNQAVNWATSNSAVVSVANGVLTPVSAGSATITATAQDQTSGIKTASCVVTVVGNQNPINTDKYFYMESWAGQQFQINGRMHTIENNGKIPCVASGDWDVSTVFNGVYGDIRGIAGRWSRITSWNGDTATFTSYYNTGEAVVSNTTDINGKSIPAGYVVKSGEIILTGTQTTMTRR